MSILINDMEMPDNCIECPIANKQLGICEVDAKYRAIEEHGRPDYCPLVEVMVVEATE